MAGEAEQEQPGYHTVLVCGGRDFADREKLEQALNALKRKHPELMMVITGAAKGADLLAQQWAVTRGIHVAMVPALWDYYRAYGMEARAGTLRNAAMLNLLPDAVIAFPGGAGTADMVRRAQEDGLPVWRPLG